MPLENEEQTLRHLFIWSTHARRYRTYCPSLEKDYLTGTKQLVVVNLCSIGLSRSQYDFIHENRKKLFSKLNKSLENIFNANLKLRTQN